MRAKAFSLPANNTILLRSQHPSNAEPALASVGQRSCLTMTERMDLGAR